MVPVSRVGATMSPSGMGPNGRAVGERNAVMTDVIAA
jgi:hypothetical protein